jgi:threonine dehydrogenase-like Zn-dependent dehydrogenase
MRQLTFIEPGRLEWWDVDEPRLEGAGEALVEPVAVATCDLDTLIVAGGAPFEGPFAFGHECVARVVEGPLEAGTLVSVPFQISCGECDKCRAGATGNCTSVPRLSTYGLGQLGGLDWGGFLSDRVRVPYAEFMLSPLPEAVSPEAAASVSDNLADAWRTVGPYLDDTPGAEVLVTSMAPSIGLYAAAIALAMGAGRVEELGAEVVEGFPEKVGQFPITVDVSNEHEALTLALRSTAPDGNCTVASVFYEQTTPVPMLAMYTKIVTLRTGRVHARPIAPRLFELIASGRLRPEEVVGRMVAWDDAADALAEYREKLVISRQRAEARSR